MPMDDRDLMAQAAKVESLLADIEALPDPHVRAMTAEIVQALLILHGKGLDRILGLIAKQGDPESRARILEVITQDELLSHLLFLHDLHPVPVEARVAQAIECLGPHLKSLGAEAELIAIEDGMARVH